MEQTDNTNKDSVQTTDYVGKSAYNALYRRIKKRIDGLVETIPSKLKEWATSMFVQSINGKSGSSITIVKGDVGLANVDNTADKDKRVAHANTAGDSDTLDGKHAADFMLKNEHETFEVVITQSLTDLDARKVDKVDGKGLSTNDYTNDDKNKLTGIETGAQKNTVTSVAGKTGDVTLNTNDIIGLQTALDGKQDNLPFTSAPTDENKVVTQNELKVATSGASNYLGTITSLSGLSTNAKKGDFYRVSMAWPGVHVGDIIIAEKDNPSAAIDEINWSLLHNELNTDTTYTFADGVDGFKVTPSVGSEQKVNVQVNMVNGHTIESNVPSNAVFTDTVIDNVQGDGIALSGGHNEVIALNNDTKNAIANAKTDHTNLGGHTVGKDVPSNAVFTDYQATKEGHYTPVADGSTPLSATAAGGAESWSMDVVKAVKLNRDAKGHVVGVDVVSGKVPANPNTDYQATKAGHYMPTEQSTTISPDTSVLRDTTRDMAFVGAVKEDEKRHVTAIETCAILAFTDAEIQEIINETTAQIAAEMA